MKSLETAKPVRGACLARFGMAVALLVALGAGVASSSALAVEPPPILWGKEPPVCPSGSAAGQCSVPRGIAADPRNGHVFVVDQSNLRIDEFNALGQFIKAWGWGVDTGAAELQDCTQASTCQAGLEGSGAGQFSAITTGISLDSAGNVYVQDRGFLGSPNVRVQKFSPDGEFLLMFGGEVNKTKVEAGGASEGEENLCPFDPGDECKAGTVGSGQGQFGEWAIGSFIAIDGNGTDAISDDKVYVGDIERIQVFDASGAYQDEIALPGKNVQGLATDAAGNLYVIYEGQPGVHKLSPAGAPISPETFELPQVGVSQLNPTAVSVDSAGHVYAFGPTSCCGSQILNPIIEFDSAGNVIAEFGKDEFSSSTGLATNWCPGSEVPGNLYVTNAASGVGEPSQEAFVRAYGTEPIGCFKARTGQADPVAETAATLNGTVNPKGEAVEECFFEYGTTNAYGEVAPCEDPGAAELGTGNDPVAVHADLSNLEKGTVYHFRLIAVAAGETETGADEEFKTKGPPVISADHLASATDTEATLEAFVNPEGFSTTCSFEYGSDPSYGQSTPEQLVGTDRVEHLVVANIVDLAPGVTYHWRIVCVNGSGATEGGDRVFSTFQVPAPGPDCPNREFRTGASALLPDCRAYEMVSPVDKNGGDIFTELSGAGDPGGYVQSAPDGNSITYTAIASFATPPTSFRFNQYLGVRKERGVPGEGWSSQGIHTPVAGRSTDPNFQFGFVRDFIAFSPDLCSAWLIDHQTPPPTIDGQEGYPNLYRRDNCGTNAGSFEALVPNPPYELPSGAPDAYVTNQSVQGLSEDSRHAVFAAQAKLNSEADDGNRVQLYDRFCSVAAIEVCQAGGGLSLVSVLPDGSFGDPNPGDGIGFAATGDSAVGSGTARNLDKAVSTDGSRVYWNTGRIYLRLRPELGISADECSGATAPCTLPVSAGTALFWTATADGSRALYSEGGNLYEFDLQRAEEEAAEPSQLIASGVEGVAGASEDLSRIYFVSTDVLQDSGPNSEGDEAAAGQPNLYLAENGTFTFIGTLVPGDIGTKEIGANEIGYNVIAQDPYGRATRVTSDGAHIAFQSRASLTGYDNAGAEDGRPSVEVFTYEAGGAVLCVSCNPSGARPSSRELGEPYRRSWELKIPTKVFAAAWLPTWEHKLHPSNVLSDDGGRLFFNSHDALLPGDANGVQDVYEWEASGIGSCTQASSSYFPQNGGCLYLISTGESSYESEFWEASVDGRDVFFTTEASLLPQDPGSIDLYDARVGGGFPQPIEKEICEGETCQSSPPPPAFPTGASATFSGPGDPPKGGKRPCPRGKRKVRRRGKTRCVKKKARHQKSRQRRAGSNRRAAR